MIPADVPIPIVLAWLFVLGAVVGSFLNVCVYRIPQHESLWDQLSGLTHPPSSCPYCKRRILARDNVPILGWIMIGGRCRFCRHAISARYAFVEFVNGVIWVGLYVLIVPAGYSAQAEWSCLYSPLGALGQPGLAPPTLVWLVNAEYLYFLILAEALLVASLIDYDLMIIPDGVTIPGMIFGVLGAAILGTPTLWPLWFFAQQEMNGLQAVLPEYLHWMVNLPPQIDWCVKHPHWHGLINSLMGLIVGGGVVWLVRRMGHYVFKREAMGFGDVTLMAMIGSFLGWQPAMIVFFLVAPLCALFVTLATLTFQFSRAIPFGPYLSMGAMLVVLLWNRWFSGFETFFSRGPLLFAVFLLMGLMFIPLLILVRAAKSAMGYRDNLCVDEWTSGDQLTFYANKEDRDSRNSMPPSPIWPGIAAGQGTSHANRWRGIR